MTASPKKKKNSVDVNRFSNVIEKCELIENLEKNHFHLCFNILFFLKKINKSNEKTQKTPKKETFLKCYLDVPTKRYSGKKSNCNPKNCYFVSM